MTWYTREELHRCNLPEYDHEDPHKVGDYWQCDYERCYQLWYVASWCTISYTLKGEEKRQAAYSWQKTRGPN